MFYCYNFFQQNEEPKVDIVEDLPNSNHVTEKKETIHPKVQPTTEQLMIAKIIDHSDDPHQRKKIQQVMDVTGKPEDEVATALFDAGWDESRAVELLLEDGDHLSAWEETGKKKNKKKSANTNDKDEWDDDEGFHEGGNREKSQGRKGPPRMRRGGSNAERGPRRDGDRRGDRDFTENGNGDQVIPSGKAPRRGDQPPRRGGRGGGNRNFSSRQQSGQPHGGSMSSNSGGFQGSIDTWNNPGETQSSSAGNERESQRGGRGGRRGGRGGGPGGKDAFDNAGNWGDDFPQADDWDNEEYTGSLADTKVFTASQGPSAGGPGGGGPKQKTPPSQQPQSQPLQQPPSAAAHQQPPVGANSQRGGSSFAASLTNGPSTATYSQSIDLSTLLQKPTTQSSVGGSTSAAPGAQFNQQAATETLKAVVGIGQSSSGGGPIGKEPTYSSYAQASAFTSINKQGSGRGPQGQGGPPQSQAATKPASQGVVGGRSNANRMPQASAKIPAVEMPGDSLGRLDVSFGALDLQFGGSGGSANSESMSGGFEFGANPVAEDKTSTSKPTSTGDQVASFAPSAKEVNKSLSNALTGGPSGAPGGKLNAVSATPSAASSSTQQDSFSKAASTVSHASAAHVSAVSASVTNQPQSASSGGSGFGNKQDYYNNSYNKGYTNYQQYQYQPTTNNYTTGSSGGSGAGSQYKGQVGPYDKYDSTTAQLQNNPAAAVLGLASTSTTNALSGKVSATTASKFSILIIK